jgi:two-component system sensor histidine kinase DegS
MPQSLNSEMLAKIIDGSSIPSFVINREHIIIHWNTAIEALTDINREDAIGSDYQWKSFYNEKRPIMADLIVDGATEQEIEKYYGAKYRKSTLIEGAYEAEDFFPELGKDGKWLRFTASPIRTNDGQIIGAIETLENVSERKLAEQNLIYYLKEITTAQEEERKRIARELHDDTAQVFGALSRHLDNFIRKNRSLSPDVISFLTGVQTQLNQGAQDLHRFCQELRLSVLDDFGLIPALRSLLKRLDENEGVKTNFKVVGEVTRYSPEAESMLFRIVQEAINNVRKHAQATKVRVLIEFVENGIKIAISDNGRGFEFGDKLGGLLKNGRLGFVGIQERVRLLGGDFEVRSKPGKGTTLRVQVNFPQNQNGLNSSARH